MTGKNKAKHSLLPASPKTSNDELLPKVICRRAFWHVHHCKVLRRIFFFVGRAVVCKSDAVQRFWGHFALLLFSNIMYLQWSLDGCLRPGVYLATWNTSSLHDHR